MKLIVAPRTALRLRTLPKFPVTLAASAPLTLAHSNGNYTFGIDTSGLGGGGGTIADKSVTYPKIQDVTASQRVLGRRSAGSGTVEECTLSQVLDFIGSAAQGDVLYRGASTWARLAAGTSGYVFTTQGAGANPTWLPAPGAGGGLSDAPSDGVYYARRNAVWTNIASGFLALTGGTLTPPSGLATGLIINQTVTGVSTLTQQLNQINVNDSANLNDATTDLGSGANGLNINYLYGGGASRGSRQALQVGMTLAAPTNAANLNHFYVAAQIAVAANTGDNGADFGSGAKGSIIALDVAATAKSGATFLAELSGLEIEIFALAGCSMKGRLGMSISDSSKSGGVQGVAFDDAIQLTNSLLGGTPPGWKVGIAFDAVNGGAPISTTGVAIQVVGAQTMDTFIGCSNLTCTNAFIIGPGQGFVVDNTGNTQIAATAQFSWAGQSRILSPGNGTILLADAASTSFNRLEFGGSSSAYPALKRSGASLQVRFADDSGDAPLTADTVTASFGSTKGFFIGTQRVLVVAGATAQYTYLITPDDHVCFSGGNTTDRKNYYDSTAHRYRTLDGGTDVADISASGLLIGNMTLGTSLNSLTGQCIQLGGSGLNDGYLQIIDHTNTWKLELASTNTDASMTFNAPFLAIKAGGTTVVKFSSAGTETLRGGVFVNQVGYGYNLPDSVGNAYAFATSGSSGHYTVFSAPDSSTFFQARDSSVPGAGPDDHNWGYFNNDAVLFTNRAFTGGGIYCRFDNSALTMMGNRLLTFASTGGQLDAGDVGISRGGAAGVIAFGNGTTGNASATILAKTKAGAPTTGDVPAGTWALIRDTSGATTKLYYNNAGTLQSVALV